MMIKGFHLELTNKCTLKCPRCARTTFIDKFGMGKWKNADLNLADLKRFLDIDLTGLEFNLCGNNGDPIYHDGLFDLVRWVKSNLGIVSLTTNGSYKKKDWWEELVGIMDSRDTIVFSVDGIPENFTNYRINADWTSIETGMRVVGSSNINSVWKYIPFKFNENSINQAKSISDGLGIKMFSVRPSDRWIENDPLKPDSDQFGGQRSDSIVIWRGKNQSVNVDPECLNTNSNHYISANGFYMPCCYVGDWRFYYASDFYKNQSQFDISNTTISEILKNTTDFYGTLLEKKHKYCTFNCPAV